jgi:hypothetical protein
MNRQACVLTTPEKDIPAGGYKTTCKQIEKGSSAFAVWSDN